MCCEMLGPVLKFDGFATERLAAFLVYTYAVSMLYSGFAKTTASFWNETFQSKMRLCVFIAALNPPSRWRRTTPTRPVDTISALCGVIALSSTPRSTRSKV